MIWQKYFKCLEHNNKITTTKTPLILQIGIVCILGYIFNTSPFLASIEPEGQPEMSVQGLFNFFQNMCPDLGMWVAFQSPRNTLELFKQIIPQSISFLAFPPKLYSLSFVYPNSYFFSLVTMVRTLAFNCFFLTDALTGISPIPKRVPSQVK